MTLNRRPKPDTIENAVADEKKKKEKRRSSSGKGKGSDFEREIAKKLSFWWTGGARDDIFYRSHSSGARFTSRKKSGKDTAYQSGDITCSDPDGKLLIEYFSIECKTGYADKTKGGIVRWDALDTIDSSQKEPVLKKLWRQCQHDARECAKEPILIFRRNQRSPCIMMKTRTRAALEIYYGDCICNKVIVTSVDEDGGYCIISLRDLIKWIPDGMKYMITCELGK